MLISFAVRQSTRFKGTFSRRPCDLIVLSQRRTFVDHNSRFWNAPRSLFREESLSNVCGHLSFCLLGASYVTQDILSLRSLAMGGISLSILFQYFRAIPLWIPIRWNGLFLAINGVMVAVLVKERDEANRMAPWQRNLFETDFKSMGFTEVEFCRLLETSKRLKKAKNAMICIEGVPQDKMYFVLSGEIEVQSKASNETSSRTIAMIESNSFIGEMTYLTHLQESSELPSAEVATASCVCSKDTEVLEWNFSDLTTYLQQPANRGVANALQAKLSNDLRLKLKKLNRRQSTNNSER